MKTTVTIPFGVGGSMLKAVQVALFHEQYPTDYKHMSQDDDYYELIKSLWSKVEPFIINEHDIIPWPGAIREIEDCDHPWCTFWYRSPAGWLRNGLGLVKFNPQQLPNIFAEKFEETHWGRLDMQIAKRLQAHGLEAHTHSPSVTNLNPNMFLVSAKVSPPIPDMRTREDATI